MEIITEVEEQRRIKNYDEKNFFDTRSKDTRYIFKKFILRVIVFVISMRRLYFFQKRNFGWILLEWNEVSSYERIKFKNKKL